MTASTSNTDSELVLRLQQDDLQAFDEIYWKYQAAVYQNVFKLTHNETSAEDVVQEVFINLWERRHTIDAARSVGGWLFVSSYNRTINLLKKQLKESLALKELQQLPETEESLSEIRFSILEKAITTLSPQKRRVFELCKLQGHSYEEAADQLQISKHTVKEYLSSAISSIKEYARQHGTDVAVLFFLKTLCS